MARRKSYRRRYKTGRWAPNITELNTSTVVTQPQQSFFTTYTIATNPQQDNIRTSQTYTIKNIEINAYIDDGTSGGRPQDIEDVAAYIMYVPEGMNITVDYNTKHPEYIMAYKFLGGPSADTSTQLQQYQPLRIRSRLSRRLQTGDSVILFIKGVNQSNETNGFHFHGLFRWWSKAN